MVVMFVDVDAGLVLSIVYLTLLKVSDFVVIADVVVIIVNIFIAAVLVIIDPIQFSCGQ